MVLFAGAFQIAELLVGPPERSAQTERAETGDGSGEGPIPIEILRLGEQSYRIEVGGMHAATVRLDGEDEAAVDDLVACVNRGVEQARQDGSLIDRSPDAWLARQAARHRLAEQVDRIHSQCLNERLAGDLGLPPLPSLPPEAPETL